ncbi:MAG: BMP family ABC transporter substrate-binding protein [Leucobacter sp.]|nr:BMP family ABC transporter substrate-binding protein [Leucobacter sp.]
MTISTTTKLIGLTAAAGLVLGLSACGQAPEAEGGSDVEAVKGFKPCMVSDEGGFDDKSFNQLGFEGLTKAAEELDVKLGKTESKSASDYVANLDGLIGEGCTFIVSVGFMLSEPTVNAAKANPDVQFAIIDDWADNDGDGKTDADNIKPLVFDTAQAAFLGGYASAAVSETGTVGTFGGAKIPPVTIFMDGFQKGVEHFNKENSKDIKVLGWDFDKQDGQFTGEFAANDTAKQMAQGLLDQGADVLLPVGGPIYQSAGEAIRDSGGTAKLVGVDANVFDTDPKVQDILFTSIMKSMDVAVYDAAMEAAKDEFSPEPFVGILENNGVSLSSFNNFEDKVPADLQSTLDAISADIIAGKIKVESPSSP